MPTGLATSTDGISFSSQGRVLDIGGSWQQAFMALDASHQIGRADSDGWSANTAADSAGYLVFGPYKSGWSGVNTASFNMMVDWIADHVQVARIEVFDSTSSTVLASRELFRDDWDSTMSYQIFPLSFTTTAAQVLEFRVYWFDTTYTRVHAVGTSQGASPFFDDRVASFPGVFEANGTYYLHYEGAGLSASFPGDIGLATSQNGRDFRRDPVGPFLTHNSTGWERTNIGTPSLFVEDDVHYLFYHGFNGTDVQVGVATYTANGTPTKYAGNPILATSTNGWDSGTVGKRSSIIKEGGYYYFAYEGSTDQPFDKASWSTGLARSTNLLAWDKAPVNPVLPTTGSGFGYDGPELLVLDGEIYLYVRAASGLTDRYVLRPL